MGGPIKEKEEYYFIELYNNKKLYYGLNHRFHYKKITLKDKEYEKIINLAFSKEFNSLDEDLSDNTVLDGQTSYITIYRDDGTIFKTGGYGLYNKNNVYNQLVRVLEQYTNN